MKSNEIEYCMKCENKNPVDKEVCDCGGRNFVFGGIDTFTYTKEGGATCNCGSKKFTMMAHINRNPIYDKTYMCASCGTVIGTQTYYKSPYC